MVFEKLLPALQDMQTRFAVGVHGEASKLPARHAAAQLVQVAYPEDEYVLPATHAGMQARAVALHA